MAPCHCTRYGNRFLCFYTSGLYEHLWRRMFSGESDGEYGIKYHPYNWGERLWLLPATCNGGGGWNGQVRLDGWYSAHGNIWCRQRFRCFQQWVVGRRRHLWFSDQHARRTSLLLHSSRRTRRYRNVRSVDSATCMCRQQTECPGSFWGDQRKFVWLQCFCG